MYLAVLLIRGVKNNDVKNSEGIEMFGACIRKMLGFGVLAVMVTTAMAQGRAGFGSLQVNNRGDGICLLTSIPMQALDNEEISELTHMREEEKLARDIYQTMYSIWSDGIFQRISLSEQRHMDAIGALLERYALEDPAADKSIGEFSSIELQNLYQNLVAMGQLSHVDALKVGAMIEDLDLYDLQQALNYTDNEDIKIVYQNLIGGSQNHMRAFIGRLQKLGESYAPQYISDQDLSDILVSGNAVNGGQAGRGRGARQWGFRGGMCLKDGNTPTQ